MKLFKYGSVGFLSALGVLAACGSDANTGGGSSVPCNIAADAPCPAIVTCAQQHCASQLSTAFGADYKSGACKDWITCLNACACGDASCTAACDANPGQSAACQQAYAAVGTCADQACPNVCNGGGAAGSGAGGGSGSGSAGFSGSLGTAGSGTAGSGTAGSGTAGSGTAGSGGAPPGGGWDCEPGDNPGDCACVQFPGLPAQDNCTSKGSCCVEFVTSGYDSCVCTDPGASSCSDLATQVAGSVVSSCPP